MTSLTATTPNIGTVDPFAALRGRISGEIITPEHEEYEQARTVHIAHYDRRPSAIVRVASTDDVAQVVRFARRQGMPLAVRSGGHSVPGLSMINGGVTVDLAAMNKVTIDPVRMIARAEAGATSRDVALPAHEHGLALTTGDTASVGLGGLVTGGGIGYMSRKYGLTIDNLISALVVTADGEVRRASADEHPDLFWAIRGGGGNFGIVTEFELRLAPVDTVLGGVIVLPGTREVVRAYLDYMTDAPDGLTTLADLTMAPPAPFIPGEIVGKPVLMVLTVWTGDDAEGERALAPLRAIADPLADTIQRIPYPAIYEYTAQLEERHGVTLRSMFTDQLSDAALDEALAALANATAPVSLLHMRWQGGAIAQVPPEATAFAHRTQKYFVTVAAVWPPEDPDGSRHERWANDLWSRIRGEGNGVYVNFLQNEGPERIKEAYPAATLQRLREIKTKYDPQNVFRYNQNIHPL